MPADLHLHSNMSDGEDSPSRVVELAADKGLTAIALTDHDIIDGVAAAQGRGWELGIEVIAGVEFTTENPRAEIHILGFFIDCGNEELLSTLKKIQADRIDRIYRIVEKLKKLGVELDPEAIISLSGRKSPGRPHVAHALLKKGIVPTFKEAFNRFLDVHSPAYEPHYQLSPAEAIKLINRACGVAVFAHPSISRCDDLIPEMIGYGLRGIEAYYGSHYPETVERYVQLAKKYGLVVTGGSDYHGENSGREVKLGDVRLSDNLVEELRNEYLRRNKS